MSTKKLCVAAWLLAVPVLPAQPIDGIMLQARAASREAVRESIQKTGNTLNWQKGARLHHGLKKERGVLTVDEQGIEFRPAKGPPRRWPFLDISTFDLTRQELTLTGYKNRDFHLPGVKSYRFNLSTPVPPAVASGIAQRVGKPSRNADPKPDAPGIASIPARHHTPFGGSNGTLRFGSEGIDYLTPQSSDSRSWRWTDIQTVSSPNRYQLIVFGYRDTYSFELKEPVSEALMDRITDEVYTHNNASQRSAYGEGH